MVNIHIVCEINLCSLNVGKYFGLGSSFFGAVKLTKNADRNNFEYSGYGIRFDAHGSFSLLQGSEFGRNVILFGTEMSSLMHVGNK